MAREIMVMLMVVVGDDVATAAAQTQDLRGRELPGVPGSWVSRVAVHADLDALRARLRPTASTAVPPRAEPNTGGDPDDPEREFAEVLGPDDPDDDPRRLLR